MKLEKSVLNSNKTVKICGSKSISNRLLILDALFQNIKAENLSDSQDTQLLQNALNSNSETVDIHHAGTAMRFLTAYFAVKKGKHTIITGSERMKQRPIKPLVDALVKLGAEIYYTEKEGYPPLKIIGKEITTNTVSIPADISSQFITALMLIAPKLKNGLRIFLEGKITSRPYIEMTLKTLRNCGISAKFQDNCIEIQHPDWNDGHSHITHFEVESDWSSASYYYAMAAVGKDIINLKNFGNHSLQGDSRVKEIYWDNFGINTITDAQENQITLLPEQFIYPEKIELNLNDCPDIAQTVCVTAACLKIPFHITGLETLKIKETDRILALQNELFRIGCITEITDSSIASVQFCEPQETVSIKTYHDHRMAMSFAVYSLVKEITIENPEVVEKSYPKFWEDLSYILLKQP